MLKIWSSLRLYSMFYGYRWFKSAPRYHMFVDALLDYERVNGVPHKLDKQLQIW